MEYNRNAGIILQQLIDESKNPLPLKIILGLPSRMNENIFIKLGYPDESYSLDQKNLMSAFENTDFYLKYCDVSQNRSSSYQSFSFPFFNKNYDLAYVEHFKNFAPLGEMGDMLFIKKRIMESGEEQNKS